MTGRWGTPAEALKRAIAELQAHGIKIQKVSAFRETAPVGPRWQPNFVNAVVLVRADRGLVSMLMLLKGLERAAGRRQGGRWGPRPLDIDILDFGQRIVNWPARPPHLRPRLVLPHPELHKRDFALRPLREIMPGWRHPVLGLTAEQLMKQAHRNRAMRP